MNSDDQFIKWATDLQSLAQAGLHYGHDVFDRERYEKIRKIAGEMMAARTGLPKEQIKTLFWVMRAIKHLRLIREQQFLRIIKFCLSVKK